MLAAPVIGTHAADPDSSMSPAGSPSVLSSPLQFWTLTDAEKALRHPVSFEFVVYYHDPYWKLLWGKSGDNYIGYWPIASSSEVTVPGQRILLEGSVVPSKGQTIDGEKITRLGKSSPVEVLTVNGDLANAARYTSRIVSVEAYVNRQSETDPNHLLLELAAEGLPVSCRVLLPSDSPIPQWEGAFVRLQGVYVPTLDPSGRIDLWVANKEDVAVRSWIESDGRFNLPATPIEKLRTLNPRDLVRVVGLVQAEQLGKTLTIRDETGQVTVKTAQTRPVEVGERIEVIGYPVTNELETSLLQSFYRRARELPGPTNRGLPKLRVIEQVKELRSEDAGRAYPVQLNGVVTWSHPKANFFFLQDGSGGIKVMRPINSASVPSASTRVEVSGFSRAGELSAEVQAEKINDLETVPLPESRAVSLEQAITGIEEGRRICMNGYVREVRTDIEWSTLELTTSAGDFTAIVPSSQAIEKLRGAVVRVTGVCSAITNSAHHVTGVRLWLASELQIEVDEPAPADPFSVAVRTTRSLREFSTLLALGRRVQVHGVVLAHTPGHQLRVEDNGETLLVFSRETLPLAIGDRVKVVGIPGRQSGRIVLREAVYQRIGAGNAPSPVKLIEPLLVDPELDGHIVTVHGTLLETSHRPEGVRLTLRAQNFGFEALLDATSDDKLLATWAKDSRVAVTGVYEVQWDEYLRPSGFVLRMRLPRDVSVIFRPPWWTTQRTWMLAGILAVGTLIGLAWVLALRRQVQRQTDEIRAQLEKGARLESELMRASKLESLGLLAGGIAHDFNNLLMVMMGNATLVLHDRSLTDESRTYLKEVEKAARRGRDLTQQLLTFAKGGAPVRAAIDLARIVRESAGFAVHGSSIRCDLEFGQALWFAEADKGQMAQVVHNVVLNAVQAMPTGGVVKITVRNKDVLPDEVPTLRPGRYLKMIIADQGSGISPQHLARIFDPYFTTKQHGSGLGLATVYSIVKRHQGHLAVTSKLGEGTTFQFWLPAAEERNETRPPIPVETTRGGRVLFMDDEEFIRNIAASLLRRIDCEPTVVSDGAAAVQAFSRARSSGKPFDVVILDLTVPGGVGGAEAMMQIRAIDPSVRAIVSSGYSSNPVMANFQQYGFQAAVPKPYEVEELMRAVQRLLRNDPGAN